MKTEKITGFARMSVSEIMSRYGFSRSTLARRIANRQFPAPTGRNREGFFWDAKIITDFETKTRQIVEKSFTPAIGGI